MNIIAAEPKWGQSLNRGYVGFITRERSALADGIEWFERFDDGLPFVHVFVVTGPAEIVEAFAPRARRAPLAQYVGQKDIQCFIRAPIGWTPEMGEHIAAEAERQVGQKYGYALLLAQLMAHTWLGHWINVRTRNAPDRFVSWLFNDRGRKICSQLAAIALKVVATLRLRGCLRRPSDTICPKELGNDDRVFQPATFLLR